MKFVLYTSTLNQDDHDVLDVPDIIRTARRQNEVHHITGVLLFDGLSFTQYIEGDDEAVDQLTQNILDDKRHKSIVIIATGQLQSRSFAEWQMGYIDISDQVDEAAHSVAHASLNINTFKSMVERYTVE